MNNKLWRFTDDCGSFESNAADKVKGLYFPLANENLMSSVTPYLHGDIKAGQRHFLLTPVSRIDLSDSRSSRNFWAYINQDKVWSATGVSKDLGQIESDQFKLEAGLLWHKVSRQNKGVGLKAEILSFVPSSGEPVEVMQVTFTNISKRRIKFTPTAAIPIYGRGADSLRDHRHVTSLLQRITVNKFGVLVKPTLSFDESGHRPNDKIYFVLGCARNAMPPKYIYPTQEGFCGDAGDLEAPESIYKNLLPGGGNIQGREACGALRFGKVRLMPGRQVSYIILMGIAASAGEVRRILHKFNTPVKVQTALKETRAYWLAIAERAKINSGDRGFDNWFRWVSIQPELRRIFGCSFLPDFDYGKGGRGWRDLWQDCLGLILHNGRQARRMLINNFGGVRIDGSNATIIGKEPGEFIADRNNISRVWCDHGVWPLLTLDLYLKETGDYGILFKQAPYFCGRQPCRAGRIYRGTVIEHLLIENLTQFFNVGAHNHLRLEGADWNDGLDMAKENGESVAFSCMYAHNLNLLAQLILESRRKKISVAAELKTLLRRVNYNSVKAKTDALNEYRIKTRFSLSGKKIKIGALALANDLREKSLWMTRHIRKKEWLKEGFFNGYYDNNKERVEGKNKGVTRMMLASQVFPIISGVATGQQVKAIMKNIDRYLFDRALKGYRLNTDFGKEQHSLGRAFSFSYGDKENGAFFNHMTVMLAYGLYQRGFVKEAGRVLSSIYRMATDTERSKIYPCLPEYFNSQGRGMYSYLTGSASWFALTALRFREFFLTNLG